MTVTTSIDDLLQTAGDNQPTGSASVQEMDDHIRALSSYIALLRQALFDGTRASLLLNPVYSGTLTGGSGVVNLGSQVYKDATGNVGIGTTSPTTRLSVASGGQQVDVSGTKIAFKRTDASYVSADGGSGSFLIFETGGSNERMRIDELGNLIPIANSSAPTLTATGQFVFTRVSNTIARLAMRGSDGTTRYADFTLTP